MNEAASYKLSLERAARLSILLEAELTSKVKSEPLVEVLHRAKEQAAVALSALVDADAENPPAIRKLQNEVRRFDELVAWLQEILIAGPEAEQELSDLQRQEARGLILDQETADQLGVKLDGENHED
ncbi:hypothetical protein I6F35_33700 [Bradyrhizobium sp. BRP22]|uniref:hypothetical protein n=1 Tax=Bradyrhizobium sp. BRP22 TaxID=2793821 RepID=UPI001CD5C489|nr:hypothetical protein [Bradyrhizobium sp. BRP22]MCA1458091.1 hypothetical protein [Bradyrhizobium sp. BRP22]